MPIYRFSYAPHIQHRVVQEGEVLATSKMQALLSAVRCSWQVNTILIWHIGQLKLMPFFRQRGARIVLFLHGIEVWGQQGYITRYLLNHVNLFLSNSHYTWQRFISFHPRLALTPHHIVHLGVGSPEAPRPLLIEEQPVMLMISRLVAAEDYKGHRELIQVWPQVLAQLPNAQLWIAGDGNLRSELEALTQKLHLTQHIRFWGYVSEAHKNELLRACRCLAMPSKNEGFGLVYLEAMRLGKPCLVSTLDAGQEVIQPPSAGLAVDPSNTEALVTAIICLLHDDAALANWSYQARQRYEEQFTATHFQKRLVAAIYDANH